MQRCQFYDRYGPPASSPEARAALKALPFGTRARIISNYPALLFGPVYFFVKGMWRKGLTLLLIALTMGAVLFAIHASDQIPIAVGSGLGVLQASLANYAYYLHRVKHSKSWNPFEGSGRRKPGTH